MHGLLDVAAVRVSLCNQSTSLVACCCVICIYNRTHDTEEIVVLGLKKEKDHKYNVRLNWPPLIAVLVKSLVLGRSLGTLTSGVLPYSSNLLCMVSTVHKSNVFPNATSQTM